MMSESLVFKIQDVSCSSERFLEFCLWERLQAFIPELLGLLISQSGEQ